MTFVGTDATQLPLAMLIVFGSAKLLSEIFEHFRQPGIVAEMLAFWLVHMCSGGSNRMN